MDKMDCLAVREYEVNGTKKTSWTRIGVFFPAKNGEPGGTIQLDANPINGKIVIRPARERDTGI